MARWDMHTAAVILSEKRSFCQERRIRLEVESLERDTGVKLRVLAQNYPDTPGLAIRDFWGVDADTIVFVADPSIGNIINVNVGENIDLLVPRVCMGASCCVA